MSLHICLAQTQITLHCWVVALIGRLLDCSLITWTKSILTEELETKHTLEQLTSINRKNPSIRDLLKGFTVHGTERSNGTQMWSTSSNLLPLSRKSNVKHRKVAFSVYFQRQNLREGPRLLPTRNAMMIMQASVKMVSFRPR